MAIKYWDYLKLKNGDKAAFIPPVPNGAQRGGITGTQEAQIATNASNISQLNQAIVNKEATANKVVSLSSASTDTEYPSAKCVYDLVGNVESLLEALL